MYFLSINKVKQGVDRAALGKCIPLHIEWVKQMIAEGKLAQAGKWGDAGGMAIVRAKDQAEAKKILESDPLANMVTAEIAQFYPEVRID